jgi:hypothetical protein
MSVGYNPRIVTDGLAFAYDMGNTYKSWLGKPTTNLVPAYGVSGMQNITYSYLGIDNGWQKYSISGTWSAGTYPYSFNVYGYSFQGGVTYSTGYYFKTNVANKFEYFATGMNYVNEPMNFAGTSFSIAQPDGSLFVGRTGFQYTNNVTSAQPGYLLSKPLANGTVFSASTDFLWVKDGQVEQGTFCTPFTSGTRTTANSVIDMTRNATITASSLSYSANNRLSFNGTSDTMDCGNPTSLQLTTSITIDSWVNTSNTALNGNILSKNYNSGYRLRISSDNSILFLYQSPAGLVGLVTSSSIVTNNTWYNITVTGDSGGGKIYLNGTLVASAADVYYPSAATSGNFYIGSAAGSSEFFSGSISNVKVYNRALSAMEIKQNFNAIRGRFGI